MKVARAYALALSTVLAWPAADVLVAAWTSGRNAASTQYDAHTLALYSADLTRFAFHEPNRLGERAQALEAQRPHWDAPRTESSTGSWDDFAAAAAKMGAL